MSSASLQDAFEKVSTEKASAEYLKMPLHSQSLPCTYTHTPILHRQTLYLAANCVLKPTFVWFMHALGLQT